VPESVVFISDVLAIEPIEGHLDIVGFVENGYLDFGGVFGQRASQQER